MSNMKIILENFRDFAKEEAEQTLNEQRKEIEEDVTIDGKKYKLLGQILTMFGQTRVDLRLVDVETGVVVKAAQGKDIDTVKDKLTGGKER